MEIKKLLTIFILFDWTTFDMQNEKIYLNQYNEFLLILDFEIVF